jgi:hypothetical protein
MNLALDYTYSKSNGAQEKSRAFPQMWCVVGTVIYGRHTASRETEQPLLLMHKRQNSTDNVRV